MDLKDILVCLDPTDAGEARLRLAAAITRSCRAHLSAAYILPEAIPGAPPLDGLTVAPPTSEAWMPNPAAITGGVPASGEGADTTRGPALAELIEQRFREEMRPDALEGDWHLFGGGESAELTALSQTFDLIVYGQTSPDWRVPVGFRPEDLIVASGRPLLVVPYAGDFAAGVGRRVLVAWDGTREAARALHDALPLIGKAEAVTLMTVRDDEADFARDAPALARLVQHLSRQGLRASHERTVRGDVPVADLLLSRAADLDIDLIVAGAYHHSQFREALVGGVSRDLLDHMTVPVLMAH
jgi:nucleotide-binding universal stress UspA family protein